ncbi:MAG: DNA polymerase [Patescibacteria group bacterium]
MSAKGKEKLVLIDSNALVHRAFHALPPLTSPKGVVINAVFGFSSVLIKMIKEIKPDYIVATFDLAGPTFRHEQFEQYKAKRVKAPQELYDQIPLVKEVLEGFGIPIFTKQGYEADDLIGTIATRMKQEANIQTIIATGDLDTLQLVESDHVVIFTLRKGVQDTMIYDEKAVRERYGLNPDQLADYRGLKGDPSDNIPGVPGIGEITGAKLIQEYGSLEELYENLDKLPEKLKEKLEANKDQAFFSKQLSVIVTDLEVDFSLAGAKWRDHADVPTLEKLFTGFGFKSLIKRLGEIDLGRQGTLLEESAPQTLEQRFADLGMQDIYEKLEKPLVPILEDMQRWGIKIDTKILEKLLVSTNKELEKLEKEIYRLSGVTFNINSPSQLGEVLFNKMGITGKVRKTGKGALSTAAPELEKLSEDNPIIEPILQYRELQKLKTTYIEPFPALVAADGRIHTTYNQTGTTTGRISSENPNLQNIPIRTELGQEFRKAFIAEDGYLLLSCDYSQIDLRVVAHIAKDEKMIAAFRSGEDIHTRTANVLNISRREAKALNFGIIYGMGAMGFARSAGVNRTQAREFIDAYLKEFKGVAAYMEATKRQAHRDGYVETLFGRRRVIPELSSTMPQVLAAGERMAINMPIQGTAADIMKLAMIQVHEYLQKNYSSDDARMLLQIHDELVFEVKQNLVPTLAPKLKEIMENVHKFGVPIVVDTKAGKNWQEMSPIQ